MRPLTCHIRRSKILYSGGCKVAQMDCNRNRLPIKRKKNVKKLCDSNIYQYLCTIKKKKGKNMNRMINVARILKKKPQYCKLFSNDGGSCMFGYVDERFGIISVFRGSQEYLFDQYGNSAFYTDDGVDRSLYPSEKMHDWTKFSWEKGNIVVSDDEKEKVIFDHFTDDDYNLFIGRPLIKKDDGNLEDTEEDMYLTENYHTKFIEMQWKPIDRKRINHGKKHL